MIDSTTSTKKKILWVEDDKFISSILSKKLVVSDFDVFHAKNGDEAFEMLKTITPNVIVVDLLLPGMSGLEILEKLKTDEKLAAKLKNVPTMVLSNLSKQSDIEKAEALGVKRFIIKAITSLNQIVAEIKALCV